MGRNNFFSDDVLPDEDYVSGMDDEDLADFEDEELGIDYHEILHPSESQSQQDMHVREDNILVSPLPSAVAQQAATGVSTQPKVKSHHHIPHVHREHVKKSHVHHDHLLKPQKKSKHKHKISKLPIKLKTRHGIKALVIHKKHGKKHIMV